ncbi:MAG: NAD-dependent epimerase/dehydratase family protein [Patescibacteria group bacterium]
MNWNDKSVLVTGGSGMIGSFLVDRLKELGAKVTSLSRSSDTSLSVDLNSLADLKSALADKNFDVVYHLASAGVNPKKDQGVDLIKVNVESTRNLLTVLEDLKSCPVITAGSWTEYGVIEGGVVREDYECKPTSPYGESKLECTKLCCEWAKQNNRPLTVLRLFSVYGEGELAQRLGPSVYKALKEGRSPELTNPDFKRDFVYISDVVDAFIKASDLKEPGLILNIGTGKAESLAEFVEIMQSAMGTNIQPIKSNSEARPWDVPVVQADLTKCQNMLNWIPDVSLSEGIGQALKDYKTKTLNMISFIFPAFNEAENIKRFPKEVIPVFNALGELYEIIIIDDGSQDATASIAASLVGPVRLIKHEHNKGLGAALRTGFEYARGDIVITIESDLTWSPSLVSDLLERYKKGDVDVVCGSPKLAGFGQDIPSYRVFISHAATLVYSLILGAKLTSVSPMFRLYRREQLMRLPLKTTGFDINAEILFWLIRDGRKVAEIPTPLTQRLYGESKLDYKKEMIHHLRLIFRMLKMRLTSKRTV